MNDIAITKQHVVIKAVSSYVKNKHQCRGFI